MVDFLAGLETAWMQGKAFPAPPATWHLGLLGLDGKEVSGGGYQRIVVPATATALPSRAPGEIRNAERLESAVATADWGRIAHVGVFASRVGGPCIIAAKLAEPGPVFRGQRFVLDPGKLRLQFDAPAQAPGSIL